MDTKQTIAEYYDKKAQEYEEVYSRKDTIRLQEQKLIQAYIEKKFKDRLVLELACGTGYWTKYLLPIAQKIIAIDQSKEMLTIAKSRYARHPNIVFLQEDAYTPPTNTPAFTGCMANFLFSHILRKEIPIFLETLHKKLANNAFVMFVDSNYQKGFGGILVKKDGVEDTWKRRKLNSGEEYEVLKNYFTKEDLKNTFGKYTKDLEIQYLTNFWIVGYYLEK